LSSQVSELSTEESSEGKSSYLDLQAFAGITKHLGGTKATKELVDLCYVEDGMYVLDVGCGVGATTCYLAKEHDCQVVGVDISDTMIKWSRERAVNEGVEDKVELRIADAVDLPFQNSTFDVVIVESVNAFIKDKKRAVNGYVRVLKQGGYVGLNETYLKKEPSPEMVEAMSRLNVDILMSEGWRRLLEDAGLKNVTEQTYEVSTLGEIIDRIKLLGASRILRAWYRILSLYIGDPSSRKWIKEEFSSVNKTQVFMDDCGYGLYAGQK
jgi:SAM-dependent methyltransferase